MLRKLLYGERASSMPRATSSPLFSSSGSRKSSVIEDKWSRAPSYLQVPYAPLTLAMDPNSLTAFLADHHVMSLHDIEQNRAVTKTSYASPSNPMNPITVNAEWNPTDRSLVILAADNALHLVRSRNDSLAVEHVKKSAHKRAIVDVDWCRGTSELVTAAQEEYILMWDCRAIQRPALAFSSLVPSTRARFNKLNKNVLASCHDNGIYLWDVRRPSCPTMLVGSHASRVYSLDWSPASEHHLASSGQDATVKVWDCSAAAHDTIDKHIVLENAAWTVQFSPLADAVLTCYERTSSHTEDIQALGIWSLKTQRHVHTYCSQSPFVKVATSPLSKAKECRVVALVKHGILQTSVLYPLASHASSDHLDSVSLQEETREGAPLQDEFNRLQSDKLPYTELIKLDLTKRICLVLVTVCLYEIELTLSFPKDYPKNVPPTFSFSKGSNLQSSIKAKLQKVLRITSTQHVSRNQPCLEPCLKQLIKTLESIKALETTNKGDVETDAPKLPPVPVNIYGGEQDSSVPFPRTSGARFCGAHFLVCFTRPSYIQKNQRESENEVTPRSLSALGAYIKAHRNPLNLRTGMTPLYPSFVAKNESDVTISSYYYRGTRKGRKKRLHDLPTSSFEKLNVPSAAVLIYSMPGVLPVCYQLASKYKLDIDNPLQACKFNFEVARDCKRTDLIQVWTLASQIVESHLINSQKPHDLPWPMHVFGRQLAEHLIDSYLKLYDIQTVAMLCCVFGEVNRRQRVKRGVTEELPQVETGSNGRKTSEKTSNVLKKTWQKMMNGGSPYNSITNGAPSTHAAIPAAFLSGKLSKKDPLKDFIALDGYPIGDDHTAVVPAHEPDVSDDDTYLLNPGQMTRYDQLKQHYAELLYKWNLLEQRCLVLNHITTQNNREAHDVQFKKRCAGCALETEEVTCAKCRKLVFKCTVCEIGVRGNSFFCLICYHGGHSEHMKQWFESHRFCPTGCGCECVSFTAGPE